MEILNLDELAVVRKCIVLDGQEHQIQEMSVEDFIAASAEAKRLEAQTEQDSAKNLQSNVDHLQRVIPTLEAGRIAKLKFAQLMALIKFVNGQVAEAAAPAAEAAASKGDEGK